MFRATRQCCISATVLSAALRVKPDSLPPRGRRSPGWPGLCPSGAPFSPLVGVLRPARPSCRPGCFARPGLLAGPGALPGPALPGRVLRRAATAIMAENIFGPDYPWKHAGRGGRVPPTMILSGADGADVWIANLDAVLDERFLRWAQAIATYSC